MKTSIRFAIVILFFVSCEHEPIEPEEVVENNSQSNFCDSNKVYFQNDILPIFVSSCAFSGCHDAGTGMSGVKLNNYENVMASDVITPGRPDNSELYERLLETDINERMPLGGNPLPQAQIDQIEKWILDGALNSSCEESKKCDTSNVRYSGSITKIIDKKCIGCHRGNSPGGGIDLSSYAGVKAIADDQRFLNVVLHAPGYKAMPLGGSMLPECEIESIRVWINQGAPNN